MNEVKEWMLENKSKFDSAVKIMDAAEKQFDIPDEEYHLLWDYAFRLYPRKEDGI
jgi:hypothetical protein